MGEIETLQTEKTNWTLRKMRLEEEMGKVKKAADAMWNLEGHIESDCHNAQYDFDMLEDWKGNVYNRFSQQYQGMFWEQYNLYDSRLYDIALELDRVYAQKEQEKEDAEEQEQEIARRVEMLLYEQGY